MDLGAGHPPAGFAQVLILKEHKVVCFDRVSHVLILKIVMIEVFRPVYLLSGIDSTGLSFLVIHASTQGIEGRNEKAAESLPQLQRVITR